MSEQKKAAPAVRVRVFRESPEKFFLAGFTKIANTRMKNVPICNPKLRVSSLPFRQVNGQWVGGIVTPWSLLVIRACGNPPTWERIPETKVKGIELPGGEFSFMGIRDLELGEYQSCSLLSPTWEVGDQATAEAVVRISLDTMLSPAAEGGDAPEEEEDLGMPLNTQLPGAAKAAPEPKESAPVTRRELFTKAADAVAERANGPVAGGGTP